MESSPVNIQAVEKFKSLVELNYKEPVNGHFNDCTNDILKEIGAEEEIDETFVMPTFTQNAVCAAIAFYAEFRA